jgi:hypothetical protein
MNNNENSTTLIARHQNSDKLNLCSGTMTDELPPDAFEHDNSDFSKGNKTVPLAFYVVHNT